MGDAHKQQAQAWAKMVTLIRDCDQCDASMRKSVAQACQLLPRLQLIHSATPLQLGVLASFGDIKERLLGKHVEQVELLTRLLQEDRETLEGCVERMEQIVDQAFEDYDYQAGDLLSVEQAAAPTTSDNGGALKPSIAQYLDWMETTTKEYGQELERKQRLLEAFGYTMKMEPSEFQAQWNRSVIDPQAVASRVAKGRATVPAHVKDLVEGGALNAGGTPGNKRSKKSKGKKGRR